MSSPGTAGAALPLLLPLLIACGDRAPEPPVLEPVKPRMQTLRIGVMGPLTGPAAGYGQSQLEGVQLAAEELNTRAEQTGVRVELIVVDDEADMSAAGERVVELVYDHEVNAIIGAINSAVTHVVEMVAAKTRVPMITTTSTDPSITRTGTYWAFRCLADDLLQGQALAERLLGVDGHRRIALFRQDNRYGKMGGAELARIAQERGHPVVVDLLYAKDEQRFEEHIEAIRQAAPDAIVIWGLYGPSGRLVRALRQAGLKQPIYGADGLVHPLFLEAAGEAGEGAVVTLPFDPCRDDPVTQGFLARYHERFGSAPDSFAAHSYDAMMIIWEASQRGGCTDRTCLKDQMLLTRLHPGVTGSITLDETGNDTRQVELARIVNGRFTPLRSSATGTPAPPGSSRTADPGVSGWVSCSGASGSR
jgi:branched-chain amino acid transport system substrate-binding protein